MIHKKPIKITIDARSLAEVFIDMKVCYHDLPDWIIRNRVSVFAFKFLSILCYFEAIKQSLSTTLNPKTDSQTKKQNGTIEAFLRAFLNYEQNDQTKLLPIAEFAYNDAENISTGYTTFE